jgi:hypothetical protein
MALDPTIVPDAQSRYWIIVLVRFDILICHLNLKVVLPVVEPLLHLITLRKRSRVIFRISASGSRAGTSYRPATIT